MTLIFRHYTWIIVFILASIFVILGSGFDFNYVIPNRLLRLSAIIIGSLCVAFSAITFQTITENRILTPAIMGYEAVYLMLQAILIWVLGTDSQVLLSRNGNFLISVLVLLLYSWLIHRWLFRGGKNNVYFLLLFGFVLTVIISTFTQLIQYMISPGEFAIFQGYALTSFNRVLPAQLIVATIIVTTGCLVIWKTRPTLDVLALGRNQATSLGVDYQPFVQIHLAVIALLVAVSTSLLGPTAFMGIFVANIAYLLAPKQSHRHTLPKAWAVAMVSFLLAQLLVEHVFNYKTTVGILINLMSGLYFFALLIRPRRYK